MGKINVHMTIIRLEKEDGFPIVYEKNLVYTEGRRDSFVEQLIAESSIANELITNDINNHRWGGMYLLGHFRLVHSISDIMRLIERKQPLGVKESECDDAINYRLVVEIEYPKAPKIQGVHKFFRSIMEYVK